MVRRVGRRTAAAAGSALGVAALVLAGCTPSTTNVSMGSSSYSPATVTVARGTTVKWTNTNFLPHSVTSNSGLFDSSPTNCDRGNASGCMRTGDVYTRTFNTAGSFPYFCKLHATMLGTVVVN